MRNLWGHRDFLFLWGGQTISVIGSLVTRVALPLTALITLDATPFQMALLASADVAAGIAVSLLAGVLVDRLRRRPVMIAADVLRALTLGAVPLLARFGLLEMRALLVVALLAGALTAFFDVAYTSYLPTLVEEHELVEGNAKLTATACLSQVVAFGLAGFLVEWLTPPGAILIDALSFLVSIASLMMIRTPEPAPRAEHAGVRREIAEGLRALAVDSRLLTIAASAACLMLGVGLASAVYALFGQRELGFSPSALGMIYAVGGVTSFGGALCAEPARDRFGAGGAMTLGLALCAAGFLAMAGAPGATLLGTALMVAQQVLTDPGYSIFEVNQVSLRQRIAPVRLLGRINAGVRFASQSAMLLGTLVAGMLAERISARLVLVLGSVAMMAGAFVVALSPLREPATP
jgi:MFS family permease